MSWSMRRIASAFSSFMPDDRLVIRIGSRVAMVAAIVLLGQRLAWADTIYSESLSTGGGQATFGSVGWNAYRNDGVDFTAGPIPPTPPASPALAYIDTANALIASSSLVLGTHMALLSDAGSIDPADYDDDLTISFDENGTNDGAASPEMGWRALAQVGSTIYASGFFPFSASFTTRNVVVSDAVWHVWTGETNLSNGFNIANISGTAGNLAAGSISGLGILAIDGADSNDRLRVRNYAITATPVPEPASLALLACGGGALAFAIRRRVRRAS